jgi:hypothetical protein
MGTSIPVSMNIFNIKEKLNDPEAGAAEHFIHSIKETVTKDSNDL